MLSITIDGLKEGPKTLDQLKGAIILFRNDLGAGKAVMGDFTPTDFVMMMKVFLSGNDEASMNIRAAKVFAELMPDLGDKDIVDITDSDNPEKNPFAAFMKGMKEHE